MKLALVIVTLAALGYIAMHPVQSRRFAAECEATGGRLVWDAHWSNWACQR